MRIDHVSVRFATKRNLGDYNSMELSLQLEAEIEPGEDALAIVRHLHELAVEEIKEQYALRRPLRRGEHRSRALPEPLISDLIDVSFDALLRTGGGLA